MHILIVEDDPVVADVLGMTLEEAGHFQSTAHNIETALAELKHNAIDAVLLDINLPDGDGTRLARLIRKNHMPVPILVVSGNASTDDKIAALADQVSRFVTGTSAGLEALTARVDTLATQVGPSGIQGAAAPPRRKPMGKRYAYDGFCSTCGKYGHRGEQCKADCDKPECGGLFKWPKHAPGCPLNPANQKRPHDAPRPRSS